VDRQRQVLATIDAAFADAPRPPDAELLHERCFDDNDIVALYGVPHWHGLDDASESARPSPSSTPCASSATTMSPPRPSSR
jgi:hypothetical protein